MSSLLAHESQVNGPYDKVEEMAFQVKGEFFDKEKLENLSLRGTDKGGHHVHDRGNNRHRERNDGQKHSSEQGNTKKDV